MNRKPVDYKQYDSRWASVDYSAKGEKTTIKESGCGPTCAAMLIESITGKTFTPKDACEWSLKRGYKALKQGTYYSYFAPQFKAHGISCERLNTSNLYGNSFSSVHTKALNLLKKGYYLIACMGKGTWTSSGHYIVVWWENGKVRILDPASTKDARLNGDVATFKTQVKYYWAIDARSHNKYGTAVADAQGVDTVKIELPVLKKGSNGDSVKALQVLLNGLGYSCGTPDASFGDKTYAAVRTFQAAKKLTIDGSVGKATWSALLA